MNTPLAGPHPVRSGAGPSGSLTKQPMPRPPSLESEPTSPPSSEPEPGETSRLAEQEPTSPRDPDAPKLFRSIHDIEFKEKCSLTGKRWCVFTEAEVRKHNTPEDCWLIAHGRVYDVTAFLSQHPAGDRSIMRHAGTDSTIDFDFHPHHAQKLWAPYMLGYLEGHDKVCTIS